jgi:nucleoside-diphosphate-sugar epimerase
MTGAITAFGVPPSIAGQNEPSRRNRRNCAALRRISRAWRGRRDHDIDAEKALPGFSGTRHRGGPWIHVSDAASATVAALYKGRPDESYNIADDQPAPLNDLVEHLANAVGDPHPITVPIWLVPPFAPFMTATWLSTSLVVSNIKAKKKLEWTPCFPSYKEGIAAFVSPAP